MEPIIYPCLLHSVSIDGLDAIEEGLDCIQMLLYHGYKTRPISPELWRLFPQLIFMTVGDEEAPDGALGFEFVTQICNTLKNYFSRDPDGAMRVGPD